MASPALRCIRRSAPELLPGARSALARIGLVLAACALLSTLPLGAQSISRGEIEGTVRDGSGRLLANVSVTVTETRTGTSVWAETGRGGSWQLSLLPAGEYEIRVEAPGYLPQLLRDIALRPGRAVRVNATLTPATGPVERVDTLFAGAGSGARFDGAGGRFIPRQEVERVGDRRMGLGGLASLSPLLDDALGSEGLPGAMSGMTVDGFSFTPAAHPLQAGGDGGLPLLPRIGIGSLDIHRDVDVEWGGSAGSYVSATSRPGSGETAAELFASGTAGPLWQAEPFTDLAKPDMLSAWGGGAVHVPLGDDGARLFVGLEGMRVQTPSLSPFSNDLATRVVENGPFADGVQPDELARPWLGNLQTISGLARADWSVGESSQVMARATFATMQDGGSRFFARPLEYGTGAPFDGTDFSAAVTAMTALTPLVSIELRGALERSAREWGGTEGGVDPSAVPSTRFTDAGALLGSDAGLRGRVRRSGFQGGPALHLRWPGHWMKAGVDVSVPSYEYEHAYRSAGEFLFGSPERLADGDGVFRRTVGAVAAQSFLVPELGVFAQHRWEPTRGLQLTTGIRFDHERIPSGDIPLNAEWAEQTGLRNDDFETALNKISPRVSARWDATGTGATVLHGALAVHYDRLDPAALGQVHALSGGLREQTRIGDLDGWPDLPAEAGTDDGGVMLALFGPKLQAPRTARTSVGLSQMLGDRSVFTISGVWRRTQFMLRRADLNRTLEPSGTASDGRPVYGTLRQSGSLVTSEPGSNRRFSDFGSVWALNADGWSEYRGVTLSLEHATTDRLSLFGSYSFSSTEDNLVGARLGVPEAGIAPGLAAASGSGSGDPADAWENGVSDFDVPHRLAAGMRTRLPVLDGLELAGIYRFHSGAPFTAGYRPGVDVNGDGSGYNDPAFISQDGSGLPSCLNGDVGGFASRNACRGEASHIVDLHLSLGILRIGPSVAALTFDFFNLLDTETGRPDTALFLVDDEGTLQQDPGSGDTVIPFLPNPGFGEVTHPQRPGRMIRIGFKVALP
jgi:hypothetical protein